MKEWIQIWKALVVFGVTVVGSGRDTYEDRYEVFRKIRETVRGNGGWKYSRADMLEKVEMNTVESMGGRSGGIGISDGGGGHVVVPHDAVVEENAGAEFPGVGKVTEKDTQAVWNGLDHIVFKNGSMVAGIFVGLVGDSGVVVRLSTSYVKSHKESPLVFVGLSGQAYEVSTGTLMCRKMARQGDKGGRFWQRGRS